MVLPEVIMGISLLIFLSGIHMNLGLGTIIIAHTTFCLPFVYLMVNARVGDFDYSIIEASYDLGATEKETLFDSERFPAVSKTVQFTVYSEF